mmetsp:Transcript_4981/g.9178  ORF Transcript_4981/g.9178 Transcript_4981/m.9178 type:complete len:228 (+) Transcript_4981:2012-2695(+)
MQQIEHVGLASTVVDAAVRWKPFELHHFPQSVHVILMKKNSKCRQLEYFLDRRRLDKGLERPTPLLRLLVVLGSEEIEAFALVLSTHLQCEVSIFNHNRAYLREWNGPLRPAVWVVVGPVTKVRSEVYIAELQTYVALLPETELRLPLQPALHLLLRLPGGVLRVQQLERRYRVSITVAAEKRVVHKTHLHHIVDVVVELAGCQAIRGLFRSCLHNEVVKEQNSTQN